VDRDGVAIQRFAVQASGLPPPSDLGPYDRYVAWITPPGLHPMVRLGEIGNGWSELDEGGFNAFLFLVSAEGSTPHPEPRGPFVLRGTSPAMVLRPHDLPYILAEMVGPPDPAAEPGGAEPHAHAGHGLPPHLELPGAEPGWRPPPMHPQIDMPAQMMRLRPGVSPLLPLPDTDLAGLPDARPREALFLAAGDTLELEAGPVLRRLGDLRIPGYGFNEQIPGPLIQVEEGSTIHVRFRNRTPLPTTVHWHGIRLDAPFDGVPGVTQDPVEPGEDFHYRLRLPDEGTFWYHPHLREDVLQDMGLAGNLRVVPAEEARYAPVDREETLLLDDHLVGPEGPVPYGREAPIHALMGRFGNVLLVNGSPDWTLEGRPGEVVRLHLTNAAATRTFNVSLGELPMKLVASDVGALPRDVWVESVVIAPAERWVVDVRLPDAPAVVALENRVQALDHLNARFFPAVDTLGVVRVAGAPGAPEGAGERKAETAFRELRTRVGLAAEVDAVMERYLPMEPDRTLVLDLRVGELPFPLDPLLRWEGVFRPRVEWEGTMPDMDWLATGAAVQWLLIDPESGRENMEIDWRFRKGDRFKLRLVNNRDSLHPMQHPIHLHGQRLLVLAVDGEANRHPAWKDTVLVPVGAVVDLLVELDNPGPWMLHCHISEHLETGMMAIVNVDPQPLEGGTP
jgi:suppressor of ftsI